MVPRFLAEHVDAAANTARLSPEEGRHLTHVLRLGLGAEVAVFDGHGREFLARVDRIDRDGVGLHLLQPCPSAPESSVRLVLAQAVVKGDKMDDIVRDATMMGIAAIEPLVTEHTVAHLKEGRAPERWRRIAIASAKQCRRAVVPAIGPGRSFADWLTADSAALRLMLIEPSAAAEGHSPAILAGERPASASLLVGPEGGWSVPEIQAAVAAGCVPITLGHRTLRADAIPIVAIGVVQYLWGDL
jgi:16S rRNA (uracil1498-N3)-methyltransferase